MHNRMVIDSRFLQFYNQVWLFPGISDYIKRVYNVSFYTVYTYKRQGTLRNGESGCPFFKIDRQIMVIVVGKDIFYKGKVYLNKLKKNGSFYDTIAEIIMSTFVHSSSIPLENHLYSAITRTACIDITVDLPRILFFVSH